MTTSYNNFSYTSDSYIVITSYESLVSSDLKIRLSGGAGNTDFNLSLGGAKSNTEVVNNFNNNIFDDVSEPEHTAGDIEYRCIYLHNGDSTTPMKNVKIYISSETSVLDDEWDIGLGTSGLNGTEQTIANESTAPVDVTFTHPLTELNGLSPPDIPVGQHVPVWFRRTVNSGTGTFNDVNISIRYVFDEK